MSRMNMPRVILGGLVGGFVMNVIDMITGLTILAEDGRANLARLGLDSTMLETAAGIMPWVIVDFLMGILLVFAYAAMRPRFGAGVRTALISGFTLYVTVTVVLYGFLTMGMFTPGLFVKSSLCALVAVLAGSVSGAALYKEE